MKRFLISIFSISIFLFSLNAQTDKRAKAILDKASVRFKKEPAKVNFTMTIDDTKSEKKQIIKGDVIFKGDKFKLMVPKVTTYFDGKNQYVFMPKNSEVSISIPSKEDLENVNPAMILSSYTKNSSVQFSLDNAKDLPYHIIDVFPDFKLKKSYYKSIIKINKKTLELISVKVLTQSGVHTLFQVNSIDTKLKYDDSFFVFDFKANPKVILNDLR